MVLSEFAATAPGYTFEILGTDISGQALKKAVQAVYREERAEPVPERLKKKYLMRGTGRAEGMLKVVPELRSRARFERLNFMDSHFNMGSRHHVVFCRNVIIYFNKETQEALISKLAETLVPGGYLFVGHSETLHGLNVPVVQVAPMVYRKKAA
jgi:chemotaxis protein methyltransferase CheR